MFLWRHVSVDDEKPPVRVPQLVRRVDPTAGVRHDPEKDPERIARLFLHRAVDLQARRRRRIHDEVRDPVLLADVERLRHIHVLDAQDAIRASSTNIRWKRGWSAYSGRIVFTATSCSNPCLPVCRAIHTLAIPPVAVGQMSS